MIKIIAGGKKNVAWCEEACAEYEKRLRKPYLLSWQFMDEDKMAHYLASWPFDHDSFIVCCDERGEILSSPGLAKILENTFLTGKT